MTLRSALGLALGFTLLASSAPVHAQGHPAIDGTWQLVRTAADTQRVTVVAASGDGAFKVGDMGSGWGVTLTFSQRSGRLVLEYPYFAAYDLQAPLHYEFALDGTEVENVVTIGPGPTRLRARAEWRADTLVVTTRQPVPPEVAPAGVKAEVRRALRVTARDTMEIVTTRVGVNGASTNVVRSTYARQR